MKETPIIMSGNHPKLILDGTKTQTRRRVKKPNWFGYNPKSSIGSGGISSMGDIQAEIKYYNEYGPNPRGCPYGQVGDRLWVRETWAVGYVYDNHKPRDIPQRARVYYKTQDLRGIAFVGKWRPSIFMPRWASRITLEITEVRVERVQGVSPDDCLEEGVDLSEIAGIGSDHSIIEAFKDLWDFLSAKRGFGWEVNPWVWVISFKLC